MRIAISPDGNLIDDPRIVPTPPDFQEGLQTIKTIASELSNGQKLEKIAGGIAGPLDQDKTQLVKSPHIGGWVNKPFKAELEKLFAAPVYLENDANLGGLGEAIAGAGIGYNIVAYLTISTGVGGVRVVNGKIDENAFGFEPGHQIIIPEGNLCQCGGKGHLEAYVGGLYLEQTAGQKTEKIQDPQVWDQVARYLGLGLTNTIVHWSPDVIILGGSVTESIPLQSVNNYLREYATIYPNIPTVYKGILRQKAGLLGALALLNS